jgi:hypothetical protein
VAPYVAPAFAEWAAQTLFDQIVDAVLNWIDHGDERHDEEFVRLETAALQATVGAFASR